MNKNETSAALTILLGIPIALSALATDLYVPALPDVAAFYAAPVSAAQLTLTTYFLGLALGRLAGAGVFGFERLLRHGSR